MKKVYLLLMHSGTHVSEFVRRMTRCPYSHVAISFEEGCEPIYSFGRKKLDNFLCGGMTAEYKDGLFFRTYAQTECIIYELEITEEQYNAARGMVEQMARHCEQYKYDFFGAGIRYLRIPVSFPDRYVCSYFVADILEKAGICRFPKRACMVTPRDFFALEGKKEIYRGLYRHWRLPEYL